MYVRNTRAPSGRGFTPHRYAVGYGARGDEEGEVGDIKTANLLTTAVS